MKKWVLSIDVDLTLIGLYLFNPTLAKFAVISYCHRQCKTDLTNGNLKLPHLMPQSSMNWCFNTFDQ
jgi:hypothetical protein